MGATHELDLSIILSHTPQTWSGVAAIADCADIPVKTALKGLLILESKGRVQKKLNRNDGHNQTHYFRRLRYTKIFNVIVPVDTSNQEM